MEASEPAAATVVPDPGAAMGNTRETGQDRQLSGGNERQKRSYQFLMGLINNNSRFETTTDSDGRTNAVPDANIQVISLWLLVGTCLSEEAKPLRGRY